MRGRRAVLAIRALRAKPSTVRQFSSTPVATAKNRIYPARIRREDELQTLTLMSASTRVPLITLWMAVWCQNCKVISPLVQELIEKDRVGEAQGGVSFVEVEMDSPDLGGLAGIGMRYGINSIPTLLAFDRQEPQLETKVSRLNDLKNKEYLKKWIETEAARHGQGGAGGSFFGLFGRSGQFLCLQSNSPNTIIAFIPPKSWICHTEAASSAVMATVHPPGPDCDDRAHLLPPGVAGNCSSAASAPPNLHWSRMDCEIGANSAYHGANHNICGVCDNSNQAAPWIGFAGAGPGLGAGALGDITAIEPWRQTAAARWPRGPGQRPGDQVQWTAFLTKLCRTCEEVEQANCHFYLNHPAHPHTVGAQPVPHLMNQMVDWPSNQCTCAYHVNGQIGPLAPPGPQRHPIRYCRRDHLDIWQDLTALRNVNDDWLFNSSRDSQGQLCLASRKTKKMRASVKSSSYRACRCGATVDLNGLAPEVLQCMACQGLVHLTLPGTAASRSQPPFRIGEKRANRKYRRAQGNLRLHRHRAAHDDTQ